MNRLIYAAQVCAEGAGLLKCNVKEMIRAQKLTALRMIRAYRTVPVEAAEIIADTYLLT